MRRISSLILALLFAFTFSMPSFASNSSYDLQPPQEVQDMYQEALESVKNVYTNIDVNTLEITSAKAFFQCVVSEEEYKKAETFEELCYLSSWVLAVEQDGEIIAEVTVARGFYIDDSGKMQFTDYTIGSVNKFVYESDVEARILADGNIPVNAWYNFSRFLFVAAVTPEGQPVLYPHFFNAYEGHNGTDPISYQRAYYAIKVIDMYNDTIVTPEGMNTPFVMGYEQVPAEFVAGLDLEEPVDFVYIPPTPSNQPADSADPNEEVILLPEEDPKPDYSLYALFSALAAFGFAAWVAIPVFRKD